MVTDREKRLYKFLVRMERITKEEYQQKTGIQYVDNNNDD